MALFAMPLLGILEIQREAVYLDTARLHPFRCKFARGVRVVRATCPTVERTSAKITDGEAGDLDGMSFVARQQTVLAPEKRILAKRQNLSANKFQWFQMVVRRGPSHPNHLHGHIGSPKKQTPA